MRQIAPRRAMALGALVAALALLGAGFPGKRKPTDPPLKPLKGDESIGNLAVISSASDVRVEGVGLVVGLDNTGSDPEPGYYRQKLLDQMRKAGVEQADKILASPNTTLVIVRARIPAGVTTTDKLDAEIVLTPGSTTTSLAGGWLLATRLSEILLSKGGEPHESDVLAVAGGPVLTGSTAKPDDRKQGRVLGGCRVKKDMPFAINIDRNHRSIRTSARIQAVINQRFHQHEGNDQKGMATAKTDEYLTLKVPKVYHHNQARYFQVIKLLPVVNTQAIQNERLERWGKELLNPRTAGLSALRLEGLGPNATDVLKKGLASDNAQVRFFAAEALAYLDDPAGVDVLSQTVINRPEFRAFALAALAAMDQGAANLRLQKLMDQADVEVRYGAFNALRTQDEFDAVLGRVHVLQEPEPDDPEGNPLEMAIATHGRRRRSQPEDPFTLYVVDCEGPPMVHVTRSRRCEIVVFGKGQKLLTPVVLGGGGSILLNASDGDTSVQISRIVPSRIDATDQKVNCPLELGEVIRETAQLGATYPEIVAILQSAQHQKNLTGPLVMDAVPQPNPKYDEALLLGLDPTSKKDDALKKAKHEEPQHKGLFDRFWHPKAKTASK